MTQTAKQRPVAKSVNLALKKQAAELAQPKGGQSEMHRRAFGMAQTKPKKAKPSAATA